MATANFATMDSFPLYARDFTNEYCICIDCSTYQEMESERCEMCGGEVEICNEFDDFEFDEVYHMVESEMEDINNNLLFHKLSIKSGYYTGAQFYVEELFYDIENITNSECHYYFDMCRSLTLRKYKRECNEIRKFLEKLAEEYFFEEYYCSARFSNGEAWYQEVEVSN